MSEVQQANLLMHFQIGLLKVNLENEIVFVSGWMPPDFPPASELIGMDARRLLPALEAADHENPWWLEMLNMPSGVVLDLHFLPLDECTLIMFREMGAIHRRIQEHQQRAHEADLRNLRTRHELAMQEIRESESQRFLSSMSHEFRTPLTAIVGYSQRLLSAPFVDARQGFAVDAIYQSAEYLLSLVENLLDHTHLHNDNLALYPTPSSVEDMMTGISQMLAPLAAEKRLSFSIHVDNNVPDSVLVDQIRLRQMMINLIGNAIKFTPQGKVDVQVGYRDQSLSFAVEDSGSGLTPDEISRLGRPYYRTERASGTRGTGLGISIVKRLTALMQGELNIQSTLGVGSVFTLTIPAKSLNDIQLGAGKATVNTDTPLVLVVDDDSLIRELISAMLEESQVEHRICAGIEEAHEGMHLYPTVVLLDMNVGNQNGLAFARTLRQNGFKRRIIAMSAATDRHTIERAMDAGCNDFIPKPIDPILLKRLITEKMG